CDDFHKGLHEAKLPLERATLAERIKVDVFAIVGAVLIGLDVVLSKIIVTDYGGVTEMLFVKGLFGALILAVQLILMERESVAVLFSKGGSNCKLPWRMALFSAHMVTRALDTCLHLTPYFYAAFGLIFVGVVLNEADPSPAEQHHSDMHMVI
ncbi:hypothetical protein ACHAWF_004484, partial [Thalassiosira exigua]